MRSIKKGKPLLSFSTTLFLITSSRYGLLSDGTQWASQVTAGAWVSIKMLGSKPEKEKVVLNREGYESATRTYSLSSSDGH